MSRYRDRTRAYYEDLPKSLVAVVEVIAFAEEVSAWTDHLEEAD